MALQNPTPSEYIQHHLTNLTYGYHPDNGWSFAHGAQEASEMGFMAIHVDTMAWSLGLGILFAGYSGLVPTRPIRGFRQGS